jgi:riboflavin synthase
MFTGLIEEIGTVQNVRRAAGAAEIEIAAERVLGDLIYGDSIAVNGVCQTIVERSGSTFTVEALSETLSKTNLGELKRAGRVNLERAIKASDRLGGHIVLGHVDGIGRVERIERRGRNRYLHILIPGELLKYCVDEGSIALEGISLTIAAVRGSKIRINVIPATWEHTTLAGMKTGGRVNLEMDILARYTERLLERRKNDFSRT